MSNKKAKPITMHAFFSKKDVGTSSEMPLPPIVSSPPQELPHKSQRRLGLNDIEITHDPGLRKPIWSYHYNVAEEVRKRYLQLGPCQPKVDYKRVDGRSFCYKWFENRDWLEYSVTKDKAYCFPCFLFEKNQPEPNKKEAFTSDGFNSWKRVGGVKCSLDGHVGSHGSRHRKNVASLDGLRRSSQHISNRLIAQSAEQERHNRLRILTIAKNVRWLACQGLAFRGSDESETTLNGGNCLELLKHVAEMNPDIREAISSAPMHATYISSNISMQMLEVIAHMVRTKIRDEIRDAKFCILVDEAQDEANCEQMAIVIRFVDQNGFIRERFIDVVGVEDTCAETLKQGCSQVLDHNALLVQNMRGQGYDGASNMRGVVNGLQALFLKECSYAYYVHCFAHRLQLALVAASSEELDVFKFFQMLNCIVNIITASPKRASQLKAAQRAKVDKLIDIGELQTGKGANQASNLQRHGTTRWSSHYKSVCSLITLYEPTCAVLEDVMTLGISTKIRAEAKGALLSLRSFDFVFILHLVKEIMSITDKLCQALQKKSQDIVNAMHLISSTKKLLRQMRGDKWSIFFATVELFCEKNGIDIPDMSARYKEGTSRSCQVRDHITVEHHYHFDLFNVVIDKQVMELSDRFSDSAVDLLTLSSALDPRDSFRQFRIDDIITLAKKYYPEDFTEEEINHYFRAELLHYECDVRGNSDFENIASISKLCEILAKTRKSLMYPLIDRLIRLVLTLPVSTATTERAFSAMNLIKTSIRNKMGEKMLGACMIMYIEKEFTMALDPEEIVDAFDNAGPRRVKFRK